MTFVGAACDVAVGGDSPSMGRVKAASDPLVSDDMTELVDCGFGFVAQRGRDEV